MSLPHRILHGSTEDIGSVYGLPDDMEKGVEYAMEGNYAFGILFNFNTGYSGSR